MQMVTAQDLNDFEEEIAELFTTKRIPSVTHLCGEAYDHLVQIFHTIRPQDWVLGTWRSHCHCLLKDVPREELKDAILAGNSVALSFPKQRVLCSAIVAGSLPIAVGIAAGIALKGEDSHVHVFMGDMASEMGIAHECMKLSRGHRLPITFYIEDNGRSAQTDTKKVWGISRLTNTPDFTYERKKYLHAGAKNWIRF
jgi:TPP-dependent pyruvate/acetoin dehydrogenase alpha subunit